MFQSTYMDLNLIAQFQDELKEWCEDRMAIQGSGGSDSAKKWLAMATALEQAGQAIRQKLVSENKSE